jgi:anthranilate phosphoribosyltransferase
MVEATVAVSTGPRKRRWLKIGASALALFILVGLIHGIRRVSPKSIEADINESLGPNSDMTSVLRFLEAHRISYVGYSPDLHTCYGKMYGSSVRAFI